MTAEPNSDLSSSGPMIARYSEEWWQKVADPKIVRCKAHRKNGDQCRHAAINGTTGVCRNHGGAAGQVRRKARLRLEMAADRMARELLGIATGAESEAVRLAAIRDALDRSGLAAKTAVEVEVSAKPFELVFDAISGGPRPNSAAKPALAGGEDPAIESSEESAIESGDESEDVIVGEYDDDPLPEHGDDGLPRTQRHRSSVRERKSETAQIVDVEIVADDYTDAEPAQESSEFMNPDAAPLTPDDPVSPPSGAHSGAVMALEQANEAVADLRSQANLRSARRQ
jgi:hypothetical protein